MCEPLERRKRPIHCTDFLVLYPSRVFLCYLRKVAHTSTCFLVEGKVKAHVDVAGKTIDEGLSVSDAKLLVKKAGEATGAASRLVIGGAQTIINRANLSWAVSLPPSSAAEKLNLKSPPGRQAGLSRIVLRRSA